MRATLQLLALLVISIAFAGCQHDAGGDDGAYAADDARPVSEVGVSGPGDTQETGAGSQDNGSGDEAAAGPSEEAPRGEIGRGDVAQLAHAFDDKPFRGGQEVPRSHWKWITEDSFIGIRLNDEIEAEPARVLWMVIGQKGVFCSEAQPERFGSFQQAVASDWEAGNGGEGGEPGYWLQHVAVTGIPQGDSHDAAPWGPVEPGLDEGHGSTEPPSCGPDVPSADFEVEGQKALDGQGQAMLIDAFDDQPFWGDQASPHYVSKWVSEETFIVLRFDHPDPQEATGLDWFGLGLRGRACEAERPAEAFTHFHKWRSDRFDEGHGAQAGAYGYWMLHAATRPLPGPDAGGPEWGPVAPGLDLAFMPTIIEGDC